MSQPVVDQDTPGKAGAGSMQALGWLSRYGVWLVVLLLAITALSTIYYVRGALQTSHEASLVDNARNLAGSVSRFRNFYSATIVPRARAAGMTITTDYKETPNALPLPATFTIDFSEFLASQGTDAEVVLYSDYPFPRRINRVLDSFQREALAHLRKNPEQPFTRVETFEGRKVLRYAQADRMQPSCVGCHNTIAGSPKRDWKVGDVRGAFEVRQTLTSMGVSESGESELIRALSSLAVISTLLGLLVIGAVAGLRAYLNRNLALAESEHRAHQQLSNEMELRTASEQQALHSEARLKQIFNSVLEGVVVIDSSGTISELNDAALAMFGFRRDELLGRNVTTLMPDAVGAGHSASIRRYEAGGTPRMLAAPRRVVARRKDGTEFPIRIAVSETRSDNRRLYTAVIHDITIQEQTEKALLQAKEDAEAANRFKSEFLANMSHELRTPLNAILGHAQLMSGDLLEKEGAHGGTPGRRDEVREHTEQIMQSGWQLLGLIEEVLDLTKIESGVNDVEIELTALEPLVRGCLQQLALQADGAKVRLLEPRFETSRLQVRADSRRLRQVLLNLLSNAVKYNRQDGEVEVAVRDAGPTKVAIDVRDTGRGIRSDQLAQLFQPFVRFVRPSDGIQGTGIGLALSKRLVEQMNGSLTVQSDPGVGSTFTILIDLVAPDDAERRSSAAAQLAAESGQSPQGNDAPTGSPGHEAREDAAGSGSSPVGASDLSASAPVRATSGAPESGAGQPSLAANASPDSSGTPMRVLYIEDTPANFEVVKMFLDMRGGFETIGAPDGETGLKIARQTKPDVILLDMHLPGMYGIEVRQKLAQTPETSSIPVVGLSADALTEDIDNAMRAGFNDYLTKPLRLARLLEVLNRLR